MRPTPLVLLFLGALLLTVALSLALGQCDSFAGLSGGGAASEFAQPESSTPKAASNSRVEFVDGRNILTRSFFASLLLGDPFSGLGLLDFLIVGFAIFLVFRVTRGSSNSEPDPAAPQNHEAQTDERRFGPGKDSEAYKRAAQNWDQLKTRPKTESAQPAKNAPSKPPARPSSSPPPAAPEAPALSSAAKPSNNETEDEFLRGAKMVYCRIYSSLASADLADVKHFTSAIMFEELKPLSGRRLGQILLVEAKTLDMKTTAGIAQARVAFEVMLQKEEASQPEEIREVWRFHRDAGDPDSRWRLAAIER
jgi:predicted lipid-binding transport protein (Tim44 family)